jgi:tetratricopeptide (TPR) repeat protein
MVGVLGMLGVGLGTFRVRLKPKWILITGFILITIMGFRTAFRGLDYKNPQKLDLINISVSPEDYAVFENQATYLASHGDYLQAKDYINKSVNIFPNFSSYFDQGIILSKIDDFAGASNAYYNALKYDNEYSGLYENMGGLTLVYGGYDSDKQILLEGIKKFPQNPYLWTYLAIFEDMHGDNTDARIAINNATRYGQISQLLYNNIIDNKSFLLTNFFPGINIKIK